MTEHALLSASGAAGWLNCPGKLAMESGIPDRSSSYAMEGTRAHEMAAWMLEHLDDTPATDDLDMRKHCQAYLDLVMQYADGGELLVEQRVDYSHILGVPDSFGTSDAVILHADRLAIVDLKYGMGERVDAEDNPQLMLYALGALNEFAMLGDFNSVTMVIHQPRLDHVSEWTIAVSALHAWGENIARPAALLAVDQIAIMTSGDPEPLDLRPSAKGCRWCRAKATCPALLAQVEDAQAEADFGVFEEPPAGASATARIGAPHPSLIPEDTLSAAMAKVELVELWCKAVRAECERRLLAGQPVRDWKLVEGRRGNRSWLDADGAEALMKSFRLKRNVMYDLKLISPTTAEKLIAKKYPGRWSKLQALMDRAEGKPSVAPATDRRPALVVASVADDFVLESSVDDIC